MSRRISWKQALLPAMAMALVLGLVLNDGRVNGDDQENGKAAAETKEVKKPRAKPRGRLPAYFSAVVSPEQRKEVYTLQAKYAEQMVALTTQIAALKTQRDKEVDAVLKPEQLEQVNKKRAAAAERRKGRKKPAAPTSDAAPKK